MFAGYVRRVYLVSDPSHMAPHAQKIDPFKHFIGALGKKTFCKLGRIIEVKIKIIIVNLK